MDIETMRREAEAPSLARAADLDSVTSDLADAFTDDPAFDWFLRNDAKRTAAFLRFFRFIVRTGAGQGARIERPASGGAAAIWLPFEKLGPLPFLVELQAFPVLLGTTGLSRFGRLVRMREYLDKHHPMERRHAYLWFFGVTHAAQGHGVGSRMLKVATDRLDAEGLPAYLETQNERNVSLYSRHGFQVVHEGRPAPDGPMLWNMWREPATEPTAS
jgi:ribosomal protein S18 acetylase RimI-like enzyme